MKQVAVGRLAKVLMKGLVVAAGFAAGISGWADSAQNSFIIISGDADFSQVDDDKILVKGPRGDKRLTYQGREGWGPSNPQSINLPAGGAVKIPVWGKDGENDKDIEIQDDPKDEEDKCTCSTNWVSQHASGPAIGPKVKAADVVAIYSYPEIGVPVPKTIEWKTISNCVHNVYKVISACKKCGIEEQEIFDEKKESPPGPKYDEDCDAEGAVKGADGRDYLPYGKHHVKYTASWKSSDCRENKCHCGAEGYREYFVYLAGLTSPEYIGLDMTDEGKKTWKEYEASASITPDEDRSKTVSWELVSEHSVFENGTKSAKTDGEPVKFGGLKEDPTPSENYRGETIRAIVTLPDAKGGNGSATVTNAFTVVKVDVEIASTRNCVNVKEEKEEKVGTFISFERDVGNTSAFTKRGLESLAEVKFSIFPKDIPEDQVVKLKFDDGFLFEVEKKNRYKQAEHTYSLKDLREKEFVLHGHKASENVRDREIEIVHVASGAKDVAKYTVVEMELVPDFDRNGKADGGDLEKVSAKKIFHWWINDDKDGEEGGSCYVDQGTEVPELFESYDSMDSEVNGRADMLDLFPLWANVYKATKLLKADGDLKLAIRGTGISFNMLSDDKDHVNEFLTKDKKVIIDSWYNWFGVYLYEAALVKSKSYEIPEKFIKLFAGPDNGKGILVAEANAKDPDIAVELYHGKQLVLVMPLIAEFHSVMDMIAGLNLWGSGVGDKLYKKIAVSDPDFCSADVDVIYIHGFKVGEEYSKGWTSDAFKRLYQSGSNARFTGVTWPGKIENDGPAGLHYHDAAYAAIVSAKKFTTFYKENRGMVKPRSRVVVIAHSLGNMLASSAICDCGFKCTEYYMVNSAVCTEAYMEGRHDGQDDVERMLVHKDWLPGDGHAAYPEDSYCCEWYRLFRDEKDPAKASRAKLTWRGRFKSCTEKGIKLYNYYSPDDEVFELKDSRKLWMGSGAKLFFDDAKKIDLDLSQFCWQKQEVGKGVISPFNMQKSSDYAGWGLEPVDDKSDIPMVSAKEAKEVLSIDPKIFQARPAFRRNPHDVFGDYKTILSDDDVNKMLTCAIPASLPAMGHGSRKVKGIEGHNIEDYITNAWSRKRYDGRWLHCDLKDLPYFNISGFADELVLKGNLK